MAEKFNFFKDDITPLEYFFNPTDTCQTVRQDLIAKGFMTQSESENKYRYINYQNTHLTYNDMVVGIGNEQYIPLQGINGESELGNLIYLTDVTKEASDLVGFNTDWFYDRYMCTRIRLNPEAESNADKFQPLMLTNVKTTNPNVAGGSFENVLVCQKDSIIKFDVKSWGGAGYGMKINPTAGIPIMDHGLYATFTTCSADNYKGMGLSRYYSTNESYNKKMIKVVATESMNIGGNVVEYMKFSVKTWNVTSWKDTNGNMVTCNMPVPTPVSNQNQRVASFASTDSGNDVPYNDLSTAPDGTSVGSGR